MDQVLGVASDLSLGAFVNLYYVTWSGCKDRGLDTPLVAYPRRRRSARHRGCNSDTLSPTTPEPCTASRGPSIGPWPQHLIIAVASLPGLWSTADPRPAVAIGGHDNKKYYNTLLVHRVTEGMASCNIFLPRPCIQITGGSETPGSPLDTHTLVQKSKVATPASEFGQ